MLQKASVLRKVILVTAAQLIGTLKGVGTGLCRMWTSEKPEYAKFAFWAFSEGPHGTGPTPMSVPTRDRIASGIIQTFSLSL